MAETTPERGGEPEPLGAILAKTTERRGGTTKIEEEECECQTCHKGFIGQVTTYQGQRVTVLRARECPECREARVAEERRVAAEERDLRKTEVRERWRQTCGIPQALGATRFTELDPDFQPKAQASCLVWAQRYQFDNPRASESLLLDSPGPGVGKTTLMACIANFIIDGWDGDPEVAVRPIIFTSGPSLVRRIRNTYNIQADDHEREEDVYRELQGVKLLMLDDVGKEQPRSYRFTQEVYWFLIDERVKVGLPVVVSSRLPLGALEDVMGVDTVDRLYGMCRGERVRLTGPSYRRLKNIP